MEKPEIRDPFRLNVKVSAEINDWLDAESKKAGVPKSSLVYFAVERYVHEQTAIKSMAGLPEIMAKLDSLEKKVEK